MYLKTVRMRGFKSFAQNVELRFDEGIAVVVGPNGSGKSNIADALQWAMAVQSPAQLRAPTGQDVLFGGSDGRPAAGVCEVELVLDNECGTLPIEFNEVSVMRRLYRDGESEYFLNRAKVRRLDVLELLSDTGLGREMHSVIGQGKVEEILLSKPHERRRFVEEAAGLGKYQRRRTRAEAKLARVESELERARDLEREVRARLRPLAMQATAAERAAKLGAEIAHGRVALLSSELVGERERADGLRARLGDATGRQAEVEQAAAAVALRREAAERELAGLAAEQERAARAFYAYESSGERLVAEAGRMAASMARLERGAGRRRVEAGELRRLAERSLADAATRDEEAAALEAEAAGIGTGDVEAAAAASATAEGALAAALSARRAHAEAEGQAANVRRELESAIARAAELGDRVKALQSQAASSTGQLHAADAEAASLAEQLAAARMELADAEQGAQALEGDAETARDAERAARTAAAAAADDVERAAARLQALTTAVERGEGLSPAARALQEGGARLVVEGVEAAPGFERAVAAALGWRAGAVIAEHVDHAVRLLGEGDGELAIVLGGAGAAGGRSAAGRPLSDVCTVRDASLAALIDGIRLVDDLASVTSGVAVTAEGAGIDADRGELWRTADAAEAAWLAARAERDGLRSRLPELETVRDRAAGAAAEAAGRLEQALAAEASVRAALAESRRRETALAQAERAAAGRRDQLADDLARCDASRDLAERDLEAEAARLSELRASAGGFDAVDTERRAAAAEADTAHAAADASRRRLAEQAAASAARLAAITERVERYRADAERSRADGDRSRAQAARLEAGAADAESMLPVGARVIEALQAAAERATALAAPARAGIEAIEQRAASLAAELQACAGEQASIEARSRDATGAVTEIEIGLARSDERIGDLERRRAQLAGQHAIEVVEPERALEVDEAAAQAARLERLERRRESLGAVNPLAQEEYEQEKQRAEDLTAQCDDLERSLRELRTLIRDLTRTIDQRFAATFEAVARHFSEVIETLFPGGRGRLRLTEPEVVSAAQSDDGEPVADQAPEEPGIELIVRPAGKRIESLSLLSGGEKSLTAIAFLFSLLLTKPSPFYLLDEVEAALDDANIDRFLTLLRTYQAKAQFIVITHQRRTMEVADVLYGVSMAGDGESKVLSRRMPSEPELHEAALETA
ncbi:MAG TPA: chromosome segregation protein SMC [Gaiellales bacterium]|jgi:chromosome segregation protein